ncbi:DNA topoisomerase I [Sandarakinorhabdus cyanobacteriorum]|uniref:DNA topoisomerase 1 n=1 Tax=Sandarakinorhabdus cyanobacteriorum TaxID=1981098 RepID=A0A255YC98_9SPHN|nr:type I DNA topoisomerase [Sandarakinorhabdus cyanobacteriorum]OYQ26793.1 DNA topoisomerase I [Sandarakinorhabdus cyanobacteriorum]
MQLVIVESPAKAKTINKYLGSGYEVLASFGHVRDLPPRDGSVDPEADFAMEWEVSADRTRQLTAIRDAAKRADQVILATDPDREGEAISWHLLEVLKAKKALPKGGARRVTFNEITKAAVTKAMAAPRDLDQPLIDAYLARRALDYLVGFTLSPVLWRKLPGAKSAGRVQSVALRLVVEREREIEAHVAREYWRVEAEMIAPNGATFKARLAVLDGKKLGQFDLNDAAANAAREAIEKNGFTVRTVETKPVSRNPAPPFTTSTLQQEAARRLGFTASHTMRMAQNLYEDGHITYMRTDGVQIAAEALNAVRDLIARDYGAKPEVLPEKPRFYATKAKNAQEAHEAIRPTDFSRRPGRGDTDAERLYALIWNRTVASQMASARLERTTVDLFDDDGRHGLKATGQVVITPGFLALYTEARDEPADDDEDGARLPRLAGGDRCASKSVQAIQSFTEPPARFSEATLVKRLEELGIGRPSTYASILQTLRDRAYVRVEKNRFFAEEKGRLVTAFLERFFARYVEYDFTAGLETQLDDVSAGDASYLELLRAFWADFKPKTAEVMEQRPSDITAALDEYLAPFLFPDKGDGVDPRLCPRCAAGRLSLKTGRFGAFVACSNYPECKYTRPFASEGGAQANDGPVELGTDPDTGEMVTLRSGRFGRFVQRGEGEKPARASIPKDVEIAGPEDLGWALKLLNLPRQIGPHPETGEPITASIGRYGPYLAHAGKYARLANTAEVFETGMNAAVVKLAEAAAAKANGGRPVRGAATALAELGAHPESGAAVKVLAGRYGPYVSDGTTNATLPKGAEPTAVTLEEAVALLAARAAAAPAKKGKKAPAKKAAARKPAAKKAVKKKA